MQTNNVSTSSWTITNGAVLVQQSLLNDQLSSVKKGLVGAILAREFTANPHLAMFNFEIFLEHGITHRLTVEKSLSLLGSEVPFHFQLEMTDGEDLEVLFKAFEKNDFGVVEIECKRDDIADLLDSGKLICGNEAFEKFFPGLAVASAHPH